MNETTSNSTPSIWLLLDDRAGNRSQCLGVAEALGLPYETKELSYSWMGKLPNSLLGAGFLGITRDCIETLNPPWPDLVIAAGRRTASVARRIKRLSSGKTRLVQIMWPGPQGAGEFDLIAVPKHDDISDKPNIINILGSPHKVTYEYLETIRSEWMTRFQDLPQPRIALIVGGSTKNRSFTKAMAEELGSLASTMANQAGGSLLVSTSRRTGEAADSLIKAISAPAIVFRWGDSGENPYSAYLACADAIVVTGESMSMCSEACSGLGPVYIYAPDGLITAKHQRLHDDLFKNGYARPFDGQYKDWQHPPVNSALEVADAIRERLLSGVSRHA